MADYRNNQRGGNTSGKSYGRGSQPRSSGSGKDSGGYEKRGTNDRHSSGNNKDRYGKDASEGRGSYRRDQSGTSRGDGQRSYSREGTKDNRNDKRGSYRQDRTNNDRDDRRGLDRRGSDWRGSDRRESDRRGSDQRGGNKGGRYSEDRGSRGHKGGQDKRGNGGRGRQGGSFGAKKQRPHESEYRSFDANEPVIPAGVLANELDKEALKSLNTLSGANQEIVARHLVVAGQLIDVDPESAYQHAQAAVRRAGRVDVVREAAALTAYASGRYEEALREVRAVRRMRGDSSLRAIEADCERGLGRPEKAIEIVDCTDLSELSLEEQVEILLVGAGARADLDQDEYALMVLDQAITSLPEESDPMLSRRLMSLQAELLEKQGRTEEAQKILAMMPEEPDEMEIINLDLLLDGDVDKVRTDLRGSDVPLNQLFDGALLDLDGVCYHGTKVYPGGPEYLETAEEAGMQVGFVTNNASLPPSAVSDKMDSMGYQVEENQVMTAAMDLIADLKEKYPAGGTLLVVGTEGLAELLTKAGFVAVTRHVPEVIAVVQGYGPEVGWAQLSEAAYAINAGAAYYATNLDATLPTERGFALGNGALVSAVVRATKRRPVSAGKPRPEIFTRAAEMLRIDTPIFVGDRLSTDIAGAIAARMTSLHVLSGVNSAKDVVLAPKGQRPSFLALDIDGLNQTHPRPLHHRDGTWTCGVSQPVRIKRDGTVEIGGIELSENGTEVCVNLDTYRALTAASWEIEDERRRVRCPELNVVDNESTAGVVTEPNYELEVVTADSSADESESTVQAASQSTESPLETTADDE